MKLFKIFSLLVVSALVFNACQLLDPIEDNHSTFDRVYDDPAFAEGLLIRAFAYLPSMDYRWDEVATDDAVSNDKLNGYLRMAKGEWSALYNPQNFWDNSNRAIIYINQFLSIVDTVNWKWTDADQEVLFRKRLKGEAYALRGFFKYFLLRNHGGIGANGELLGIPIYDDFPSLNENFSKPRATFTESVASVYADFNEALKYLPMDYGNITNVSQAPAEYGITDINDYNVVFGDFTRHRISARIVKAMISRFALLVASPAFNPNSDASLWQNAANYSADVLKGINGISGLDSKGNQFFLKAQIDAANLASNDLKDLPEIVWRRPIYNDNYWEEANFPPSLFGSGRVNPTQNLVDAFPMANGYPISDVVNSKYNPANPYSGRDPRLALYIVTNGSKMSSKTINTGVGAGTDGLDATTKSTRTGYYMRKFMREDVNADPSKSSNQQHFITHIRYTEIFLNYAEAANEAWGPDGTGANGFSARDVVRAIRKRAGITQPDNYLNSIASKDDMRALIHNERRLELCFEGFRFWDLRRWKDDLNVTARGVRIEGTTFNYFDVEERKYDNEYMMYGPIPYQEVLKNSYIQNKGW